MDSEETQEDPPPLLRCKQEAGRDLSSLKDAQRENSKQKACEKIL